MTEVGDTCGTRRSALGEGVDARLVFCLEEPPDLTLHIRRGDPEHGTVREDRDGEGRVHHPHGAEARERAGGILGFAEAPLLLQAEDRDLPVGAILDLHELSALVLEELGERRPGLDVLRGVFELDHCVEAWDRRSADRQHVEGDPARQRREEILEARADGVLELGCDDICWDLNHLRDELMPYRGHRLRVHRRRPHSHGLRIDEAEEVVCQGLRTLRGLRLEVHRLKHILATDDAAAPVLLRSAEGQDSAEEELYKGEAQLGHRKANVPRSQAIPGVSDEVVVIDEVGSAALLLHRACAATPVISACKAWSASESLNESGGTRSAQANRDVAPPLSRPKAVQAVTGHDLVVGHLHSSGRGLVSRLSCDDELARRCRRERHDRGGLIR